jgi:hypothetical protein
VAACFTGNIQNHLTAVQSFHRGWLIDAYAFNSRYPAMNVIRVAFKSIAALLLIMILGIGAVAVHFAGDTIKTVSNAIDAVPAMTEADLKPGQPYRTNERNKFTSSCSSSLGGAKVDATCGCIAEQAEKELSHYERVMMLSILDGNPLKILAVAASMRKLPDDKLIVANGEDMTVRLQAWYGKIIITCMDDSKS